jgi:hypothetical protein
MTTATPNSELIQHSHHRKRKRGGMSRAGLCISVHSQLNRNGSARSASDAASRIRRNRYRGYDRSADTAKLEAFGIGIGLVVERRIAARARLRPSTPATKLRSVSIGRCSPMPWMTITTCRRVDMGALPFLEDS